MYFILLEQANLPSVIEEHSDKEDTGFFSPDGEKIDSIEKLSSFKEKEVIFLFYNHYRITVEVHSLTSISEKRKFSDGWVFCSTYYYWDGVTSLSSRNTLYQTPKSVLSEHKKLGADDTESVLFKCQEILE